MWIQSHVDMVTVCFECVSVFQLLTPIFTFGASSHAQPQMAAQGAGTAKHMMHLATQISNKVNQLPLGQRRIQSYDAYDAYDIVSIVSVCIYMYLLILLYTSGWQ